MFSTLLTAVVTAVVLASHVRAESHTVRFYNACGYGTPTLLANGQVLSTGEDYTSDGELSSAIAYLQNGNSCGENGENCTLMEMTMTNPTCAGCGSSADISLISPHAFSVWTSFAFFNGCENTGANCPAAGCSAAFYYADETQVQVACQATNAGLLIAFCADATTLDANNLPGSSPSSSSAPAPTSSSTYVAPAPSTTSSSSTYVPPTSSAVSSISSVVSSASSAAASASSSARCSARNTKRSLRLKRSVAAEPEPVANVTVHARHHARRASH